MHKKKVEILDEKSSSEYRAKRLKMLRNLANLSRQELCNLAIININTLKGWERGRYGGLPLDGAKKILNAALPRGVQCTLDWLLHEIGVGPKVNTDILKIKRIGARHQKKINQTEEEKLIINEILLFRKQFGNTIDFMVEDDGMAPLYNKGEYVAGIMRTGENIKKLVSTNCVAQLASGKILLRNIRSGTEKHKYSLFCINQQSTVIEPVLHNVELLCAASIIRIFRKNER
jgi:transcriptional regulator with XRE-family HTH domain